MLEPASAAAARLALARADAVRTVSPFTSGLVRRLGVEPAATFPTYSDLGAFTAAAPAPLPEPPSLLFVGALAGPKNVPGLAAAWRSAASRVPEARLRIVGDGRKREVVEALVRDLPGQTSWDVRLTPEELAAALDDATALVLPSLTEGLPRVAIEAFARGRPVVASRAGGIPDIVEDGVSGLLVPPGDAFALADALVRVLTDRDLAARLADGARAAARRWISSPEEYSARMRELVDAL
ncbi:MAG: glycosyltransferase family 4 protein [Actinobacteria bacterium]|nr:glycosyltransferase family 4 protein [Actinomycetota bacterium]